MSWVLTASGSYTTGLGREDWICKRAKLTLRCILPGASGFLCSRVKDAGGNQFALLYFAVVLTLKATRLKSRTNLCLVLH